MEDEVREFLWHIIRDVLHVEVDQCGSDDILLQEGGLELESLFMTELMVNVEQEYNIALLEEETPRDLTLGDFVKLVVSKRLAVKGASY